MGPKQETPHSLQQRTRGTPQHSGNRFDQGEFGKLRITEKIGLKGMEDISGKPPDQIKADLLEADKMIWDRRKLGQLYCFIFFLADNSGQTPVKVDPFTPFPPPRLPAPFST